MPGTALTVGELVGYLKVDSSAWRRGLVEARAELVKAAHDSSSDLAKMADRTEKAGDKAAASFVRLALSISNVATAAATAQSVVPIFAGLGGALAVLPALGVAVGAGMLAAKVGMAGFGDALKNTGDPAKFAASLEQLAPAARDTAVAVRDLGPAWHSVQQATQQALFAGVATDVRALGERYLPVLKTGLSGIAGEFNTAAHGTAAFLGQSAQVQTVSGIFGQVKASIGGVTAAVPPLVSILLDLVSVGSEFLPGLSGGFGKAAQSAADFVHEARETGRLHDWIASGLGILHQLGEILGNLGAIVRAVFGALDTGGAGLLNTLLRVTGQVRAFLESFQGQQALAALGELLGTVSSVVTDVLLTALRQLAPVVVALAPGFAQLATQVGSILVSALTTAGPLLVALAGFLSANAGWLGPLAIGLYAAAKAFQVVTAAVRILNIISALNPWAIIIAATVALAVLIVTHWDQITQAVSAAWQFLLDTGRAVWDAIVGAVQAAADFLVQLFLNWTLPGLIIKHWDDIVNAVRTAVGWVLDAVDWLSDLPGRVAAWFGQVKDGIVGRLSDAVDFVRSIPRRILDALGNLGDLLVEAGRDVIRGLLRGLQDFAGRIWEWIKGLAKRIWDQITDFFDIFSPSKKMRWAGQMIGLGLAHGLEAMTDTVEATAGQLAQAGMVTVPAPRIAAPAGLAPVTRQRGAELAPPPDTAPAGPDRAATVHIDQFHATPTQSPYEIAAELDWLSRTRG